MSTAPRQTLTFLRELLESRNIRPKNKLGQNFLIDQNLLDLVTRTAELGPDDLALEVGTGTGTLTGRLAAAAGAVVSVEIDPAFHSLAAELLGSRPNLRLYLGDVLRNKNELSPGVLAAIDEMMATAAGGGPLPPCTPGGVKQLKLVANLPYVVATPVICNFLIGPRPIERMVVMVQWEIAERLSAAVGSHEYSSLAILVQSVANVTVVRRLGPQVFWPRPAVDSAVVEIRPDPAKRALVGDVQAFRVFLRDLYSHRRKNLRGALVGWPGGRRTKPEVDAKLAELGIDGNVRAEELDIATHLRLCAAFGNPA
jgi:16S rRNA (adenine1518-N6/adenine1519-N6)-dimethyltransferase